MPLPNFILGEHMFPLLPGPLERVSVQADRDEPARNGVLLLPLSELYQEFNQPSQICYRVQPNRASLTGWPKGSEQFCEPWIILEKVEIARCPSHCCLGKFGVVPGFIEQAQLWILHIECDERGEERRRKRFM